MQLQERINAFAQLGDFLKKISESSWVDHPVFQKAQNQNGWFTEASIRFALHQWGHVLSKQHLTQWTSRYSFSHNTANNIAVVMAGNIPLVGFHDFLSVLISGNHLTAKLSSNDALLLPYVASKLVEIAPKFKDRIRFSDGVLKDFDAVIATGSNNTALYFEHYFGKYPHIIRKNRNGVAVLTGAESPQELQALAQDIFLYFGLGCRNVSKLYVPKGYGFAPFFEAMYSQKAVVDHHKYMNNYDYNKAVYLMNNIPLWDNEFLLLKEDIGFSSPIAVLHYQYYDRLEELQPHLIESKSSIQCLVAQSGLLNEVPFGNSQTPALWEYADGIDTLEFLTALSL